MFASRAMQVREARLYKFNYSISNPSFYSEQANIDGIKLYFSTRASSPLRNEKREKYSVRTRGLALKSWCRRKTWTSCPTWAGSREARRTSAVENLYCSKLTRRRYVLRAESVWRERWGLQRNRSGFVHTIHRRKVWKMLGGITKLSQ